METQERHSRVKAMKEVFRKKTYSLRQELQMETDALNSMLFSEGLISEAVLAKKDIDATLSAIRRALEDESIAEKTFHGFTNSVSDISSKSHLAREMEKALADELLTQGFSVRHSTAGSSHQSGRDVLSPSVDQLLQQRPDRSQRSFGTYEVETMGVTPAAGQPGPADESSILIGPSSAGRSDFELVETMKLCEQSHQEKIESDTMLLAKTSEVIEKEKQIEQLLHSCQQQQRNQYKLHQRYIQSIVDKSKQADKVRNAEDMATVAEKKLMKAREEVELAKKAEEDVKLLLVKAEEKT